MANVTPERSRQLDLPGLFVAIWSGTIVGFAAVEPRADGESELDALFVDPNMRRRGIARSLVAHCAEVARTRESAFLYVVGNTHAKELTSRRTGSAILPRDSTWRGMSGICCIRPC